MVAEFMHVIKQAKKICDSYSDCYHCPFNGIANDLFCSIQNDKFVQDLKKLEEIVGEWESGKHRPIYPTWLELMSDWENVTPGTEEACARMKLPMSHKAAKRFMILPKRYENEPQ